MQCKHAEKTNKNNIFKTRSLFSIAKQNSSINNNPETESLTSGSDFTADQLADILNCCLPDSPEIKYKE